VYAVLFGNKKVAISSTEGASIEAPKVPMGVGCGEAVYVPHPTHPHPQFFWGEGSPEFVFIFGAQNR